MRRAQASRFPVASSESVTFDNPPSNSLTIDGGAGSNNVTFNSIDPAFAAKLIIKNANLDYELHPTSQSATTS